MASGETFHDKRGREARALYDEGLSCNAIAEKMGVGVATISRWAKAEGLSFPGRSKLDAAHTVRSFDMVAARARLAQKMTANADRALDSLDAPFTVFNFGGKDNTFAEHELPEAPLSARREAQALAGIAFDKLTKAIEATQEADGLEPAESMLGRLANRLGVGEPVVDDE